MLRKYRTWKFFEYIKAYIRKKFKFSKMNILFAPNSFIHSFDVYIVFVSIGSIYQKLW